MKASISLSIKKTIQKQYIRIFIISINVRHNDSAKGLNKVIHARPSHGQEGATNQVQKYK